MRRMRLCALLSAALCASSDVVSAFTTSNIQSAKQLDSPLTHSSLRSTLDEAPSTTNTKSDEANDAENVDVSSLPEPPSLGRNIFRNLRDSISYINNPDRFVKDRAEKLGPVFLAYNFFAPTVFVGGQVAVKEFITGTEIKASVTQPSLPESFVNLHTKWGALNMPISEPMFREARELFGDVLSSREAMGMYSVIAEREIEAYVNELAERVERDPSQPIYIAKELKSICLQMFSKIFSGQGLTAEQEQLFVDYNSALLSLSTGSNQYKTGEAALESLRVEMLKRFRALDGPDIDPSTPGKWYHDQIDGRPNFENPERISTGMVLFIWGAYVECASLMADSLAMQYKKNIDLENVRTEFKSRLDGDLNQNEPGFWKEKEYAYTNGVLRETLRLYPPGAGVPRSGPQDFALAGYRIPAGTPVMLDPRIGNLDPELYESPEEFQPLRWVPENKSSLESSGCPFQGTALKLGIGSWFPGGHGAHKCPGVPLAELISRIFLAKMAMKFDSWSFSGEGLTKEGDIDYVKIPVRIPPDSFGMIFKL